MKRRPVLNWGRRRHEVSGAAVVLAAILAVGLAGCAGSTTSSSVQPSEATGADRIVNASPNVAPAPTPSPTPMPPPIFDPTGRLQYSRAYATATLLTNGKVLVAGGIVNLSARSTAPREEHFPVIQECSRL